MFSLDFLESDNPFARKSGKINEPVVGIGVGTSEGVKRLESLDHALSFAL